MKDDEYVDYLAMPGSGCFATAVNALIHPYGGMSVGEMIALKKLPGYKKAKVHLKDGGYEQSLLEFPFGRDEDKLLVKSSVALLYEILHSKISCMIPTKFQQLGIQR